MAQGKKAWAGPLALWNWGLGDVRKKLASEAEQSDVRNRAPQTIASVIYPHLPSAQQPPQPPKKTKR